MGNVTNTDFYEVLDEVAAYYTKSFAESKEAAAYLKSRNLWNPKLLKRLKVGYCKGDLRNKVSDADYKSLKEKGIFSEKGTEVFKGCVTIPLFGEGGNVLGLYGKRITDRKPAHLYLKGPRMGIVNRKAASVYSERIIITESVIDAMSLLTLGIENVIPVYSVNGFTDEHLKLLKDNRVKEVCITFNADEKARDGSEKLKNKLLEERFSVREIFLKKGRDWNEALLSGMSRDEFKILLDKSPLAKALPDENLTEFEARKEGVKYFFRSSGINYRVLGIKEMFVSSLKVNIKADKDEAVFLDNVDLYSARSRSLFANSLAEVLKTDSELIEQSLLLIVEYLENERDKHLQAKEPGPIKLTDEERKIGMELLRSRDLFSRIEEDTESLGYIGEKMNKRLIYLAASSRKLSDPISVIVISQSAAGKSYLIDTVKKLIPPEDVVSMTSLSDQALNYLPEDGLMHKFLVMGEAAQSETVKHQIREILSSHELSRLVTLKDPKSGNMQSRIIRKEVIVSAAMSSTNHNINPENASRSFVINTDESAAQTVAIHRAQRQKYSVEHYEQQVNIIPEIIKTHHAAQRLLQKRVIVNPFAELLDFPTALMRSRRDHERFIDLIASACFLRQFQKEEKVTKHGIKYIECDLEDYETAYQIMTAILPATLTNFPKGALELYEEVRAIIKDKAKETDIPPLQVSITQREIRESTGLSQMFVKRNMKILSDYEYIYASGGPGGRVRKNYKLVADERIKLIDISVIPEPSKMKTLLKSGSTGSDWGASGIDPENKG